MSHSDGFSFSRHGAQYAVLFPITQAMTESYAMSDVYPYKRHVACKRNFQWAVLFSITFPTVTFILLISVTVDMLFQWNIQWALNPKCRQILDMPGHVVVIGELLQYC